MRCIFNVYGRQGQIVATDARFVWVKVEYRRPFSGVPAFADAHRRPRSTFSGPRPAVPRHDGPIVYPQVHLYG